MPEIPFNVMISSASTGNSTLDAVIIASSDVHTRWTAELFMLLGIGSVFTVLRTFGRIFVSGIKGLDWDDYLAWMAAVSYFFDVYYSSKRSKKEEPKKKPPRKTHTCYLASLGSLMYKHRPGTALWPLQLTI